ncbi:MAG: hypothetical protein AAF385_12330 [Pseudomonadota bacterium]
MQAVVFGEDRFLFGAFHPATGQPKRHAVLFVGPLLNESMRSHSALRAMALAVSANGYDVLRFDYSGMGNSGGDLSKLALADWNEDTQLAAKEILRLSGASQLSCVATRFGAHFATRLSQAMPVSHAAFWDPVFVGRQWHERLNLAQQSADRKSATPEKREASEFLGHVMSPDFASSLDDAQTSVLNVSSCFVGLTNDACEIAGQEIPADDISRFDFDCGWEDMSSQVLYPHELIQAVGEQFK